MLEAQDERSCVPVPGMEICADDQSKGIPIKMPARGAGLILSSKDADSLLTELSQACRRLGAECSYDTRQVITNTALILKGNL